MTLGADAAGGRRAKSAAILGAAAAGGGALLSWTQSWFVLTLDGGTRVDVPGQIAAPALSALGLASFAVVAALSIAGPVARIVLGAIEIAAGAAIGAVSVAAIAAPVTASGRAVTEATGIDGSRSIAALVTSVERSVWPWVALVAAALALGSGVLVAASSRRWPAAGRRYVVVPESDAPDLAAATPAKAPSKTPGSAENAPAADPARLWDDLSDGSDPTGSG